MLTIFFKGYLFVLCVICSIDYLLELYFLFIGAGKMELKTRKKQNINKCSLQILANIKQVVNQVFCFFQLAFSLNLVSR
jgi:hypothetical protein